ncbi:hypothetical protein [Algoriphagus namhaensis]
MAEKLDPLIELAVWGNLQRYSDYSLILLNGHILLEKSLVIVLDRFGVKNPESQSFYSKVFLEHSYYFLSDGFFSTHGRGIYYPQQPLYSTYLSS